MPMDGSEWEKLLKTLQLAYNECAVSYRMLVLFLALEHTRDFVSPHGHAYDTSSMS